jgi:hypothetical protein
MNNKTLIADLQKQIKSLERIVNHNSFIGTVHYTPKDINKEIQYGTTKYKRSVFCTDRKIHDPLITTEIEYITCNSCKRKMANFYSDPLLAFTIFWKQTFTSTSSSDRVFRLIKTTIKKHTTTIEKDMK